MSGCGSSRSIRSNPRAIAWGVGVTVGVFLLFGLVTDLVPNPLYVRMVPRTPVDYLFLALTALLAGVYAAQRVATETTGSGGAGADTDADADAPEPTGENRWALGGLAGGFLAVGCPICNVFLLALFSSSALMTYVDPLRPLLGAVSVAILAGLIVVRHRRSCTVCEA